MAASPPDSPAHQLLAQKFTEIRPRFVAALGQRLDRFEDIYPSLSAAQPLGAFLDEIQFGVHRTNGLAGSFGFDRLGSLCARLEAALIALGKGPRMGPLAPDLMALLDELLEEMAQIVGAEGA